MQLNPMNNKTMSSTQLGELLGKEPKEVNKQIRKMFGEEKARESFSPDLDNQGRVINYHLPELESNMYAAKYNIAQLEKVCQFWIDGRKEMTELEQLLVVVQRGVEHERQLKEHEGQLNELTGQMKALVNGEDYFTIVGYANINGIKVDTRNAAKLGREASLLCKQNGWDKGSATHPMYGVCGTYPREALEKVFKI